jgi:hypothetical protein
MIRALRRARLAPVAVALALFATCPITVSSLLHDEIDDAICNPAIVVHDANAHRVGAASDEAPSDSQHCVSATRCSCCVPYRMRSASPSLLLTAIV